MLQVMSITGAGPIRWGLLQNSKSPSGRRVVLAPRRASDDDEIVPILSGRRKTGFTEKEYEKLRNPRLLGKNTSIGEELELLRMQFKNAESLALEQQAKQVSKNWDGDVYVGSSWNTLSVLYGIMMAAILLGLAGAVLSYGSLWGVDPNFSSPPPPLW